MISAFFLPLWAMTLLYLALRYVSLVRLAAQAHWTNAALSCLLPCPMRPLFFYLHFRYYLD